jgi:hypothetical protein
LVHENSGRSILTLKKSPQYYTYVIILFEEKDLEKTFEEENVDLDLALNAADAVTAFLDKRFEKTFERYIVSKLVSVFYEETLSCSLRPEVEATIRDIAKQSQDA